jgi:hypothetical protein
MQLTHLLLEHVGLGDRVRGVFTTPQKAREAAHALLQKDMERLGSVPEDYFAKLHISAFMLDQLDSEE